MRGEMRREAIERGLDQRIMGERRWARPSAPAWQYAVGRRRTTHEYVPVASVGRDRAVRRSVGEPSNARTQSRPCVTPYASRSLGRTPSPVLPAGSSRLSPESTVRHRAGQPDDRLEVPDADRIADPAAEHLIAAAESQKSYRHGAGASQCRCRSRRTARSAIALEPADDASTSPGSPCPAARARIDRRLGLQRVEVVKLRCAVDQNATRTPAPGLGRRVERKRTLGRQWPRIGKKRNEASVSHLWLCDVSCRRRTAPEAELVHEEAARGVLRLHHGAGAYQARCDHAAAVDVADQHGTWRRAQIHIGDVARRFTRRTARSSTVRCPPRP